MSNCDHKYVYLESNKKRMSAGYNTEWIRVDTYFCEKCLEYKDKELRECTRDMPIWFQK